MTTVPRFECHYPLPTDSGSKPVAYVQWSAARWAGRDGHGVHMLAREAGIG